VPEAARQNWVIQTLGKQMRPVKNPSITTRRDLALIASICAAPARGTPRKWPVSCLKIKGQGSESLGRENRGTLLRSCFKALARLERAGWLARTNGGSTANLSNGANQASFFPGPTALPWVAQPCTTLFGDWAWQESAAAPASLSLRKRSESLSSEGILSVERPAPCKGSPRFRAALIRV
jgi:hypothetical protein